MTNFKSQIKKKVFISNYSLETGNASLSFKIITIQARCFKAEDSKPKNVSKFDSTYSDKTSCTSTLIFLPFS